MMEPDQDKRSPLKNIWKEFEFATTTDGKIIDR
jgi:hypothetical protein